MQQSILIMDTPDQCENCICLGGFTRVYAMCRAKARLIDDPYKNQNGVRLYRIERRENMTYKNYEGYPDPTASKAVNGVRKEERQQMLEKQHGLKRGQKIVITEMSRDEMHKAAKKKKKTYTMIELYTHCVLLKGPRGIGICPNYAQLREMMQAE